MSINIEYNELPVVVKVRIRMAQAMSTTGANCWRFNVTNQ